MHNPDTILAIDPGVNGGLAWIQVHLNNDKVYTEKMPGTDFEVIQLLKCIGTESYPDGEDKRLRVVLHLEEPPLYAGKNIPGSAIGKLMWNAGLIYGAAVANGWKVNRHRPAVWMKALNIGSKRQDKLSTTQWKNRLKSKASELYPQVKVTLWNADALLILDAGHRLDNPL
jgi:hypothetical protein